MLLVIDVGNTNTSLGVYQEEELVAHWRLTTARNRTVDEYGVHARNLFQLAGLDIALIHRSTHKPRGTDLLPALRRCLRQTAWVRRGR